MDVFNRLEQRLALPDDSETRRSQKIISVILLFTGALLVTTNVALFYSLGLSPLWIIYLTWSLSLFIGGFLIIAFPRFWYAITVILIFSIVVVGLPTLLFTGGYQSGLEAVPWMLLAPLAAALFTSPRLTIIVFLIYVAAIFIGAFLEPYAVAAAPEIALNVRMQIAVVNLVTIGISVIATTFYLLRQVETYRLRAESLLHEMLPASIAARLKKKQETIAESYDAVSVLFADMVGSTPLFYSLEPSEAVDWLNEVFSMFDELIEQHGLEKIRTIGDNYMVASGVPVPRPDHAQALALLALDMIQGLEAVPARHGQKMAFRFGIHSGPVIAGVIGRSKYQYDLWGDTVNIAARMESHGEEGKVHISDATCAYLKNDFQCVSRGVIPIKGKGEMETWFLTGWK